MLWDFRAKALAPEPPTASVVIRPDTPHTPIPPTLPLPPHSIPVREASSVEGAEEALMETNKEAPQNGACKKVVGPRKEKRPSLGNPAAGSEISTQLEKKSKSL